MDNTLSSAAFIHAGEQSEEVYERVASVGAIRSLGEDLADNLITLFEMGSLIKNIFK